jgi:AhpD family alkylhydroperoxidase
MRFALHTPDTAPGKAAEALGEIYRRHGGAGPMVRAMATSPALLRGYLDLSRATKRATLDRTLTERISLAIQAELGCDYCLAAHTRAARELEISEDEIAAARSGRSEEPEIEALLEFALGVLRAPAGITDGEIEDLREWGYDDGQIADAVAIVALNLLTGSFNLVAGLHVEREGAEPMVPYGGGV